MNIERFIVALANYQVAVRDEEEERARYEGYSWGYHGERFIIKRQEAQEALRAAFINAVKSAMSA